MAEDQSQSPNIPVRPPFDDADADITFRSADGVDFRLYKVILAKASPVFGTMLALPQPVLDENAEPEVITLTEDAKTLEHVFRLCYPVEHAPITISDVRAIAETALKYEMTSVVANLREVLLHILPADAWRVYAVAYMLKLEDVAKESALLLDIPKHHIPPVPSPEFSVLPCMALYAVHEFRQNCLEAALKAWEDREWIVKGAHERAVRVTGTGNNGGALDKSAAWSFVACTVCPRDDAGGIWVGTGYTSREFYTRAWFQTYRESLRSALVERPSGRIVRTHLVSNKENTALAKAATCTTCSAAAYADLKQFGELLADRIDEAIAQIDIKLG